MFPGHGSRREAQQFIAPDKKRQSLIVETRDKHVRNIPIGFPESE